MNCHFVYLWEGNLGLASSQHSGYVDMNPNIYCQAQLSWQLQLQLRYRTTVSDQPSNTTSTVKVSIRQARKLISSMQPYVDI
jgi:hypothetical protein